MKLITAMVVLRLGSFTVGVHYVRIGFVFWLGLCWMAINPNHYGGPYVLQS